MPLLFAASACDSSEPEPDPTPVAPTFAIASVPVTLGDGTPGLQFFATPSASVTLTEVVITNPVGQSVRFNAQNVVSLQGQPAALQDPGIGYIRVSGNWTFQFIGARSPAVADGNFNVTTSLSVGAAQPGAPAE